MVKKIIYIFMKWLKDNVYFYEMVKRIIYIYFYGMVKR